MTNPKTINLALQGGGAHGAFTWGVLDKLLADGRLEFEGISGASAGAVNAVALAHGWAQARDSGRDPAEGAREALARVWNQVTAMGTLSHAPSRMARIMMGALPGAMSRVSPYQTNPLDFNPLRKLLEREIDFERLSRLRKPCVYVSATDVETGRCVVFSGKKLTVQAVVASGCLPLLFQAPEIDGRTYWDGGYSNNPALTPLVERSASRDILLVQITPLRHEGTPRTMAEIVDRINDLTFNASLIAQMRSLGVLNDMVGKGVAPRGLTAIHIHRIDGGAALSVLPAGTKVLPQMSTVQKLFVLGQEAASRWLAQHLGAVGHKSSIDLRRDYGDPLRLNYRPQTLDSASSAAPPAPATAFKPAPHAPLPQPAPQETTCVPQHATDSGQTLGQPGPPEAKD